MGTGISHPEDMTDSVKICCRDCPRFRTFHSYDTLESSLEVECDTIPCSGVALQRAHKLRQGYVPYGSNYHRMGQQGLGGAVIATDLVDWLRRDGFEAGHSSRTEVLQRLRNGEILITMINGNHWISLIGIKDDMAYVIDYSGLFRVPVSSLNENVGGGPFYPGCYVWVGQIRRQPEPYFVMYGPWIDGGEVGIQAMRLVNHVHVYLIYQNGSTKMVSTYNGECRYYDGPIEEFDPSRWSHYRLAPKGSYKYRMNERDLDGGYRPNLNW